MNGKVQSKLIQLSEKYTVTHICSKSGISRPTFYRIFYGKKGVSTSSLEKIEKAFKINLI